MRRLRMIVYKLTVFGVGSPATVESITLTSSTATIAAIPHLLAMYPGCERISVHAGDTYLFSVGCTGATLPD